MPSPRFRARMRSMLQPKPRARCAVCKRVLNYVSAKRSGLARCYNHRNA